MQEKSGVSAKLQVAVRELEDILQRQRADQVRRVQQAAEGLEAVFGRRLEQIEIEARSRLLLGVPPSLRQLTGISQLEVPMNRVLGWVFDPSRRGPAACVALMELAKFLDFEALIGDIEEGQNPVVVVESTPDAGITSRQPDLMIRTENAAVLIENKVDSPESGAGQYAEYLTVLREWAGARESRAYLLARSKRTRPDGWDGSFSHQELATEVFRLLAEDVPELPFWDRVVYGLLAGDFDPDMSAETPQEIEAVLSDQGPLSRASRATRLSKLIRRPTIDLG